MRAPPNDLINDIARSPSGQPVAHVLQDAHVPNKVSPVDYMAHLDGVRAFAVVGVIIEHWASGLPRPIRELVGRLDLGGWGVECFFVLSGFLITLLLLKARAENKRFLTALGHFYSRRALGNRLVVWLGAISYGLYIFHPFVPLIYAQALGALGLNEHWGVYYIRYPVLAAALLAITSASFYFWEQPIRRYRRYFG